MKKTDTTPLAYAYAEDGRLYTSFHWKLVEADYCNAIGKDLVNFAYLDGNQLYGVMLKPRRLQQVPNLLNGRSRRGCRITTAGAVKEHIEGGILRKER